MEIEELKKRPGKFMISKDIVEAEPEMVMAINGGLIITRCELRYDDNSFHYTALGEDFDVVPEGEATPKYDIEVMQEGEELTIKFVRKA